MISLRLRDFMVTFISYFAFVLILRCRNGLHMVIRSHECVRKGFELPYVPTSNPHVYPVDLPLLCTVFSASNYGAGSNEGAYIVSRLMGSF